jgi:hypothetical protein
MRPRILLAVCAALVVAVPATALGAPVTRQQAVRITKRIAGRHVVRMGTQLPPSAWVAACYHDGPRRWRCEAGGGGGYCNASVRISGTREHPVARLVDLYCFD